MTPIVFRGDYNKWDEITRFSSFILEPGDLIDQVQSHVKIVTDENGSCRRYDTDGTCTDDDYVFNLNEQYYKDVDFSPQVKNFEIVAGHCEIVGDYLTPPEKLISLLQQRGIMFNTSITRRKQLFELLSLLYSE